MTTTLPIPEPVVELVEDTAPDEAPVVPTVELLGARFAVREQGVSLLALMKFATVAKRGKTSDDMEGLAALYALLQSCIDPAEWQAFEDHANDRGAQGEDLMGVVRDAVQAYAARPTQLPSGSPDGRSTTGTSSAGGSSSPAASVPTGSRQVQEDLERRGRPDIALVVAKAREASTATSPR
jgi:hypothetical protein